MHPLTRNLPKTCGGHANPVTAPVQLYSRHNCEKYEDLCHYPYSSPRRAFGLFPSPYSLTSSRRILEVNPEILGCAGTRQALSAFKFLEQR